MEKLPGALSSKHGFCPLAQYYILSQQKFELYNFIIKNSYFRELMRKCYPAANLNKLEKHIFRMYDTNNDNHIDFREFMMVLYILSKGTPEQNLEQIFRIFDINNDHEISRSEMKKILSEIQSGSFAREFILENQANRPVFNALLRKGKEHRVEQIGEKLRKMMPFVGKKLQ